jgi:glycine/D-amino acid oxidase-like deaminating enzyme/nitrite reductase/ring-hydroxylating ferredoxin subunit
MGENTVSFWNKTAKADHYPRLDKNLICDVLIIGGGITGVTTAYCLAQKGEKPVLIEAGCLCDGTTGNTTGKVTIQHDIIYSNILKKHGRSFAKAYADSQTEALEFVRRQVRDLSIDCQLMESPAYIYAQNGEERDAIIKEYQTAKDLGIDAFFVEAPTFPPGSCGMVGFHGQLSFHAVRYVSGLADAAVKMGARIYCDTKAVRLADDGEIKTVLCENDITIEAKHLVMATQYPFYDGPNLFFTRLYAKRAYGIALEAKRDWPEGNYINAGQPSRSIRTHVEGGKKILIVVGEGHPTGRGAENEKTHFDNLRRFAEQIAGVDNVLATWSAQDYETPDQIPYIGRISDHSTIYVGTGYGKWGLSSGTLAGMLLADLITTGSCPYEAVYSRKRPDYSTSLGKTIAEVTLPVVELVKSKIEPTEPVAGIRQGEGRVIRFEGQRAGIYRDFDDTVTILDISCTHMSTTLNFNEAEKTWDCPAHGGRYSVDGKLLEGPPKHSLKVLFQGKYEEIAVRVEEENA